MDRRLFLKSALAAGAALSAVSAGLLVPGRILAVSAKFKKKSDDIGSMIKGAKAGTFKFKAPKLAENGAVVPLEVNSSKMDGIKEISFYVKNNTTPLAASFVISGALGFVSTRVKMAKSSPVTALVIGNDGQASAITKEVKVTVGGCGG